MKPELSEVLSIVNKVRVDALELNPLTELPKGRLQVTKQCVLARAVHANVDEGFFDYGNDERLAIRVARVLGTYVEEVIGDYFVQDIPEILTEFIQEFDAGNYPELIEEQQEENI